MNKWFLLAFFCLIYFVYTVDRAFLGLALLLAAALMSISLFFTFRKDHGKGNHPYPIF